MGFVPEHDRPVPYIERTHTYYRALGYERPYRYAQYADVPFQPLVKPLAESRVALITTAAPFDPERGDQGPWSAYNSAAKFYRVYSMPTQPEPDLRISHVGIDRKHTSQEDMRSWLPLRQLLAAEADGRIGALVPHVFGAPTNRSHRVTLDQDAPEILDLLREAGADVAVIAANCPICHQTCSLIARHLEANGLPTIVMGCAKDIVETCGVPRFLFSDFPLGNPAGRPHDEDSQAQTLAMALQLLEAAPGPRTTWQSPIRWSADADWKLDYSNVERIPADELERRRLEFLRQKEIAHTRRTEDGSAPSGQAAG
ncbi:MAG: glycine/sarcosine/betaine reductase selenoprotein B family protein [Pseudomonadota bacterium]